MKIRRFITLFLLVCLPSGLGCQVHGPRKLALSKDDDAVEMARRSPVDSSEVYQAQAVAEIAGDNEDQFDPELLEARRDAARARRTTSRGLFSRPADC